MNVKDLSAALRKVPPDQTVWVETPNHDNVFVVEVVRIEVHEDGATGVTLVVKP